MMMNVVLGLLLSFSPVAHADVIGTVWNQQSELIVDGKLFCSFDQNKSAVFHQDGGYLRIDRWNHGWFRIDAGNGCAVGWFGENLFVFQQVGNDVLDRNGMKIGTISATEINLIGGLEWTGESFIKTLSLNVLADGTAQIDVKFTRQNSFGYGEFEFTSRLTPWQY